MQLERSYFRHLSFESNIYELLINARHAYILPNLAVKSDRPHYFKEHKAKLLSFF